MAPVLGLLVVVGVEVDVVEDDGVGGRQVDAQPARLGRQDEQENTGVCVELVYQVLPANYRRGWRERINYSKPSTKLAPLKPQA